MPELDNDQVIQLVKSRLGLDETVVAEVRSALESGEESVEDVLVEMGVLTRTDLDSLIGHLPTQAGLKGVTADDEDLSDDWPTDGGRAHATALSGDALRDSLLPQVTQGSDRYEIGDEFARGGMGIIADAKDRILERKVAMKLLIGGKNQRLGWQLRFAQEAQITGQLQHPNIIPVYDLGQTDEGQLYFSMKRVEGQTLRDVFKSLRQGDPGAEHTFSRTSLLQVFQKICMAVAYAHSRAVVHRDLKPSNIMLGGYGEVLVMDWGLAKILKKAASGGRKIRSHREDLGRMATRQGEAIGTPGYMPPELALGQLHLVDERSDVFSLGAILYEMLTLTRPYSGRDAQTILRKMLKGGVTPARERAPQRKIPIDLETICSRCLSRDVSKRYSSVLELHGAIQRHLEERAELVDSGPWEEKGELEDHVRGYLELASRERSLRKEVDSRQGRIAPWEPVEARRSLRNRQGKLVECQEDLTRRFTFAVDYLRGRLSRDATDVIARQSLGQIAREEFIRSEEVGDVGIFARCTRILSALDMYGDMLRGHGRVVVETDRPGVDAWLYHVTEVDSVFTPVRRQKVGPTPFEIDDLSMGAYLLHLRTASGRHVRVPFRIRRQQSVKLRIDMTRAQKVREGFVYVPPGLSDIGGDPDAQWSLASHSLEHGDFLMSRLQVTCREYLRFLNALGRSDLDAARLHSPRRADGSGYLFRELDGTFFIPRRPFMAMTWDPNWPVFGVSQQDALAYCRWRSQLDGVSYRLPTDLEWEAAARGGDGRLYPWGNAWESAFCNSGLSHAGHPRLEPVGSHPTDLSPYGVMDLAGGVSDWTSTVLGSKSTQGDDLVICRGGSWMGFDRQARCASRVVDVAHSVSLGRGFRLALDAD